MVELLSLANPQTILIGIIGIVIAFGLAVFVHELGHFLAAKAFKVPVERFVIGFDKDAIGIFPKCIWEKKIGETTYGLSLVPLGGYVKMSGVVHPDIEKYLEGEEKKDEEPSEGSGETEQKPESAEEKKSSLQEQAILDQAALYKKPFWQKFIIYSAGVIMNLLLAMLIQATISSMGYFADAPVDSRVAWQDDESWLTEAGIDTSFQLVALNGEPIATNEDYYATTDKLMMEARKEAKKAGEKEFDFNLTFEFANDVGTKELDLYLPHRSIKLRKDLTEEAAAAYGQLGGIISFPAHIAQLGPNTPADRAGLKNGDTVTQLAGEEIDDWYEFTHIIRGNLGNELPITVDRDGELVELEVTPYESDTEEGIGQIGVIRGNPNKVFVKESLGEALIESPIEIAQRVEAYTVMLGRIFGGLFQGEFKQAQRNLGGPAAIGQFAYRQANEGLLAFLRFMIMFNIALAVMNILPIPILDGGHIVLAAYEAVFRKPVNPRILIPVLNTAIYILLGFFVLVTFSDVFKIGGTWLSRFGN